MSRWDPGTVGGGGGVDSVSCLSPRKGHRTVQVSAKLVGDDENYIGGGCKDLVFFSPTWGNGPI